uniref:hypothetical protein n=1 Tax=Scytothamnus australis TaxID=66621 RepID=UPI002E7A315D|nr:hypothetical protein V2495_pgp020 [Scytothamnus australis]WAM64789.1 hypothetical protein [Scytothamnus australis]
MEKINSSIKEVTSAIKESKNSTKSDDYPARWGFYLSNEVLNGRVAMSALVIIMMIELITRKTLLDFLQIIFV